MEKRGKKDPIWVKMPKIYAKTSAKSSSSTEKRSKTPQNELKARREAYKANPEPIKAAQRTRYQALSPVDRLELVWRRQARPPTPRRGSKSYADPRKRALANSFCDWSDLAEVFRTYQACAIVNEHLGLGVYVVDHIVPLQSPLVCGLHTHTNLEVVRYRRNRVKSNWLWPGMPALGWEAIELIDPSP